MCVCQASSGTVSSPTCGAPCCPARSRRLWLHLVLKRHGGAAMLPSSGYDPRTSWAVFDADHHPGWNTDQHCQDEWGHPNPCEQGLVEIQLCRGTLQVCVPACCRKVRINGALDGFDNIETEQFCGKPHRIRNAQSRDFSQDSGGRSLSFVESLTKAHL